MKFSEHWLREWVNPKVDTHTIVEQLTMAGLEVDGTEAVAGQFTGVVVGEIIAADQHPNADKLKLCQVSVGGETTFQVVCGAPNARVGLKAPFAQINAILPGNFKIRKAKLRGVESFGMLCAEAELGMADQSDGLMELPSDAPVGEDLRKYLNLDDTIIDVDLTPNRADCLSIAGIAREVGIINRQAVNAVEVSPVSATHEEIFPVEIKAPKGCPNYVGRVIRDVNVSVETPLWMQEKLRRAGQRSIDPIVDITNYVMLELGQPLHGFDLEQLAGGIVVRMAEEGEKLTLLDGQTITLSSDVLVIADQSKPLAFAGVMGGEHSGVSSNTRHVFLESAYFNPIFIAGKARQYGLHTESSHRFERGVDFQLQRKAIERATQLILSICGGQPGPVTNQSDPEQLPDTIAVKLRASRVRSLLGLEISNQEIAELLGGLGMVMETVKEGAWVVGIPSYRFDIRLEVDLIEEIARLYGYNNLPSTSPMAHVAMTGLPEDKVTLRQLRRLLVAQGYREAINYSFISPELQKLVEPEVEPLSLANPISADMGVMRTSLLPGLLKALSYNLNRQQSRIRLFEVGQVFLPEGDTLQQPQMLAGVVCGLRNPENWTSSSDKFDFYDCKGVVEQLIALGGKADQFEFRREVRQGFHPGQCAALYLKDECVGYLGRLHPQLQKQLDIPEVVYQFELQLDLLTQGSVASFQEISKFPGVRRDIAVVVDQKVDAADLMKIAEFEAGELLKDLKLFDVYIGKGIDPNRKSVAMGLTLQHPSRTLNEDEVHDLMTRVTQKLEERFNAILRK